MNALTFSQLATLVLTPVMIAIGQVLFKITSRQLAGPVPAQVQTLATSPVFLIALVLYGGATLVWVHVLKTVPLAYAYSFMALTFVIVPLLATIWLDEPIGWRYAAGTALILAGILIQRG